MDSGSIGHKARVKIGYHDFYENWSHQTENRLHGWRVCTVLRDGEIVTILDVHGVRGEQFCMIEAPGAGGSIHASQLELI